MHWKIAALTYQSDCATLSQHPEIQCNLGGDQ
jgi:hypothetical protein